MPYNNTNAIPSYQFRDPLSGFDGQANHFSQAEQLQENFLTTMPFELVNAYRQIADQGIYGEGGVDQIVGAANAGAFQQAQGVGNAVRRAIGRRVGPRSGAAVRGVVGQAYGPAVRQGFNTRANLLAANQQSKFQGLQGLSSQMQFIANQYNAGFGQQPDDGGFLGVAGDVLGIAADVGAVIPGPHQPFAAGYSAYRHSGAQSGQQAYNNTRNNRSLQQGRNNLNAYNNQTGGAYPAGITFN